MILLKIFLLQIIVISIILFVLWELLKLELFRGALRELEQGQRRLDVAEVVAVTAGPLSLEDESRLRQAIDASFPGADVICSVNADIQGGIVLKADGWVMDYSVMTRIKYIFGWTDAA